ncbi:MAG: hypothetical protein FRX48_06974 [Lasallia pustulata]|uniref:P-loop containing nucleoside triphosphate hydrolase n=1 Tax=Lasallia pustulata TaxID=136370 RepID=A0A5M8PJ20_9LECA|nr:MAG: hypothetical protein FRX48_06974 [Lasallia pustulata]
MTGKHNTNGIGPFSNTPMESPSITPFVTPGTPKSRSSGDESVNSIKQLTNDLRSANLGESIHVPASKAHKATVSRSITVAPSTASSGPSGSDSPSSVEIVTESPKLDKIAKKRAFAIPRSPKAVEARMAERANYNYHMSLLSQGLLEGGSSIQNGRVEELKTTPLFAASVMASAADESTCSGATNVTKTIFPQYGLLAQRLETYDIKQVDPSFEDLYHEPSIDVSDPRIFLNINTPWSAFICGSQGSGKSHTLSCMLENSLLPCQLGALPKPLAAIVFHYDKFTSFASNQICEAAYLCSSGIPVRVLVSPSNFWRMRQAYSNMPGLPASAKKPVVAPMLLKERHLDVERMMNLMAVTEKDGPMPLYMEVVCKILRQMAVEAQGAPGLNYAAFKTRLEVEGFSYNQNGPLKLRLDLLESFTEIPGTPGATYVRPPKPRFPDTKKGRKAEREWEAEQEQKRVAELRKPDIWSFEPGSLTIVDLSCPFVDDSSACALFNISLALFLENRGDIGRIVALDEAHKFMSSRASASTFTETLLSVIRQQRHLATRIIIATQEPTISPKLLDLSSMTIVHRFTSPEWLAALKSHLAGVAGVSDESKRDVKDIFRTIVNLEVGEALLFSPSAMLKEANGAGGFGGVQSIEKLGMAYLKVRFRRRVTVDGGRSMLAT